MNSIYSLLLVAVLSQSSSYSGSPSDFDYKISSIATEFRNNILDEDKCEKLKWATAELADEIEDEIKNVGMYSRDEILEFRKLKKEAEALEQFIASVGDCGNYMPSVEQFNLANKRVKASVSYVSRFEYCVDVVLVEVDDYVAYLVVNNTDNNYTLSYKLRANSGFRFGEGTMGVFGHSVRHFYNNRDDVSEKDISIIEINCE